MLYFPPKGKKKKKSYMPLDTNNRRRIQIHSYIRSTTYMSDIFSITQNFEIPFKKEDKSKMNFGFL